MKVRLVPVEGGQPIELDKELVVVGRKEDCDIRIDHKSISKMHCIIVKTDGLLLLRDLGSTNGTRVNGQRVRRAALLPNDQLHIANVKYKVTFANDDLPSISPNEYTQQMDGKELARILDQSRKPDESDDVEDGNLPSVQKNALPDVYPDNGSSESKS